MDTTSARPLEGRTALVTGAASGIGRACAEAFAAAGARVYVVDLAGDPARRLAERIGGVAHVTDLSDPEAVEALPADADIVVNNAGLQHVAPVHEFPVDRFTLIQRVMVEAPFRILRRTLPHMYAREWGRVVNVSSVHGLRASAFKSAYVTAKHALEGLSKTVALEGAPYGVTSNCVNPGYVRTPWWSARSPPRPSPTASGRTRWWSGSCSTAPPSSASSNRTRSPGSSSGSAPRTPPTSPAPASRSTAAGPRADRRPEPQARSGGPQSLPDLCGSPT